MAKQKKKYIRIIQVPNPSKMHGGGLVQCLMADLGDKNRREAVSINNLQHFLDEFDVTVQLPDGSTRRFSTDEPPCIQTISRWMLEANAEYQAICTQEKALEVAPSSVVRDYIRNLWHLRSSVTNP